ncbi:WD40 repeat domain-containing protein [Tengunoibacter tsumagoiensis]|uniref:Translation initiation factor beta propellor-like domain-containing protein n=1 Tax=Tengunoibacter tsumagoiensis TaxID=2014871 RepID=A0A402AA98_9CHLR|nr:hypothetical protein [Tengunoibacter tsumagoiensis]GCE16102.1 hypothetical protein KTT_59610 [Tengunoibacter tsumagoiensis]
MNEEMQTSKKLLNKKSTFSRQLSYDEGKPDWRRLTVLIALLIIVINGVFWGTLLHSYNVSTKSGATSKPAPTVAAPVPTSTADVDDGKIGHTFYTYTEEPSSADPFGYIYAFGWASDSTRLAVGGYNGAVAFDATTGNNPVTYTNQSLTPLDVDYSHNGQYLLLSGFNARVINIQKNEVVSTYPSLTNQALATGSTSNNLYTSFVPQSGGNMIYSSSWSPNDQSVASMTYGTVYGFKVVIWDPQTGLVKKTILVPDANVSNYGRDLSWSPDGTYLALGVSQDEVFVWNAVTGELVTKNTHVGGSNGLAWSPDSKYLVTSGNTTAVWEVATGTIISTFEKDASEVSWSPDGKHYAIGSDANVLIIEALTGKVTYTYRGHSSKDGRRVYYVAWSPDGKYIASSDHISGEADTVRIWLAA